MKKLQLTFSILILLFTGGQLTTTVASKLTVDSLLVGNSLALGTQTQSLIIDHNTIDITAIPPSWIEQAKNTLHIYYGHTSHGSQLTSGMAGLVDFANGGGLDLSLPTDYYAGLPIVETSPDAGYYPEWVNITTTYLGIPDPSTGRGIAHPDTNVVIWSWCGQVSNISEQDLIDHYLKPMTRLEIDYPGITFVYMTGHSDGSGETGNLHIRNQQIRQYAIDNHKVLYDFYDIEMYDPDGNYFGDKAVNDNCDYDSGGNGTRDANWCYEWQNSHTINEDYYNVDCAHSQSLNCNQKAYAAWWLWASIAGWDMTATQPDLLPTAQDPTHTTEAQTPPESESPPVDETPPPESLPADIPPSDRIDDFDGTIPPGTEGWQPYWDEATKSQFACDLENNNLRIDFDIAVNSWATCTLFFDSLQDWSRYQGVAFSYYTDAPTRIFDFTLHGGTVDEPTSYQHTVESVPGSDEVWIPIDLTWSQILGVDWEANARNPIDPARITGVSFGFSTNDGTSNNGTIWIDDLQLLGDETPTDTDVFSEEYQEIDKNDQTETETEDPPDRSSGLCPGSMAMVGLIFTGVLFQVSISSSKRRSKSAL